MAARGRHILDLILPRQYAIGPRSLVCARVVSSQTGTTSAGAGVVKPDYFVRRNGAVCFMAENGLSDNFDRLIGALHGLPDVVSTKAATIRAMVPLVGNAQTFIVQTYRQSESGDTIFLECVHSDGSFRIALPPKVADAIARQRESLSERVRSRAAKAAAQDRKRRGIVPFARKEASGE